MKRVGAVDVGTTKVKAGVYDESGKLIDFAEVRSPLLRSGPLAEHDPNDLIDIVNELVSFLVKKGASCIGITTYRGSLVVWEKERGRPLTNVVTWMDLRSSITFKELPFRFRLLSRLPKLGSIFSPESLVTRLLTLIKAHSGLKEAVYRGDVCAWNVDAYILYSIARKCITDATIGTLTGIYHPKTFSPMWRLIALSGVNRFDIPKIVDHEEIVAKVENVRIGSVLGDQQAASIGSDCVERGCLKVTLGSGLFLDLSLEGDFKMITKKGLLPIVLYKSKRKINWGVEAYVPGIGTFVDDLLSLLNLDYRALERSIFIKDPIFILPTIYGLRFPKASKGLTSLTIDYHGLTRERVLGSLLHSIALLTSFYYEIITKEVTKPRRIVVTGGLSRSVTLTKLIASYIGSSIVRTKDPHMSLRGAARVAARACLSEESFYEPEQEIIDPDPDLRLLSKEDLIENIRMLRKMRR